jgi:peptidoglycan/xylan/chitin deacetylase (PgdA/CDA1 family)
MSLLGKVRARIAPAIKTRLLATGAYSALRSAAPSRQVAILRYHAVCGEEGETYADPGICVTPGAFDAHVRYLAAHYAVLPMPEVVDRLRQRKPLPRNCVVITFDDGYADNLEAARTLNRHGITGTFFITAGCMAGGQPFWPSEVRALVAALAGPQLQLAAGERQVTVPLVTEAHRHAAVRTLNKLFKSTPIPVRESLREQVRDAAGRPDIPSPMLRWDQIVEMHRMGMTIGAHTMTHPNLPSAGAEAAAYEVTASKARLEQEIGAPVTMFSYPNGGAERYMTAALQQTVRDAGYAAAATSRNAFAGPDSDLYALERIEVEEELSDLIFALEVERFLFRPQPRQGELSRA